MRTFIVILASATLMSVMITPLVIRLARYLDIVDQPGVRKIHRAAIPRIGGVAIYLSMLIAVIPVLALNNVIGEAFERIQIQVFALFLASTFVFLLGLIDDVLTVQARIKLLGQLLAAVLVCALGVRMREIDITENYTLQFGWVSWPLTVCWITGITNAVNLIDGLDGLAAGLSAITCAVMAVFAICTGQPVMAVLMLALLGSLMGFLFFNFNPARVFMGDCGALFLGFVLATSSVMCVSKKATLVAMALPVLALGVPIFDTLFSILRRALERRSLFAPDQDHIHHRLLERGLDQRRSVLVIYLMSVVVAGLGLYMLGLQGLSPLAVLVFALVLLVSLFRSVGAVRLGDSLSILRRNMAISRATQEERNAFEHLQLRIRRTRSFQEWWQAVCEAAEKMDFARLSLDLKKRNGQMETLAWTSAENPGSSQELLELTVPIRDRRCDETVRMAVGIRVSQSLESAGRRASLFVRLMDEYGLDHLQSLRRTPDAALEAG